MTQAGLQSQPRENALIALGSNATSRHGAPRETVLHALREFDAGPLSLVASSRLYLTPFFPKGAGADVVNAVALIETALDPRALLDHLHGIEADFDRTRRERWRDRTLDLDIVAMGARILPDRETLVRWMTMPLDDQKRTAPDGLILPHPRLQDRAFVLVPAADVAPDWSHPLTGRTIAQMRDALPREDLAAVKLLEN